MKTTSSCLKSNFCFAMMALLLSGCASSMNYVRQHKGEGVRRSLMGSEAELMDSSVKVLRDTGGLTIIREPHAVLATANSFDYSIAFYFYPSQTKEQTEVEALIQSGYSDSGRFFEKGAFIIYFFSAYINARLLEVGYDPNVEEEVGFGKVKHVLSFAALNNDRTVAIKLIKKGANLDVAINELKEHASGNLPYLDRPANRSAYDKANLAVEMLNGLAGTVKVAVPTPPEDPEETAAFEAEANKYRALVVKSALPEEARKYNVQAVAAFKDKQFSEAAELYANALKTAPWWPDGHFNRALILGELNRFVEAMREMKRYLQLAPDAPNARAAQDKIYEWERFTSQ